MKDNKNIVVPFLHDISVPEWAVSEIFGERDENLPEEGRKALDSFLSRWIIMDYGENSYFCTPAVFYGGFDELAGTCLCCKCLPKFLGNAKLYRGDLVQRMGRTRAVFVFDNGKISERVFSCSRPHATLLTNLHLLNSKVLRQDDIAGYMVFKGGGLIFASDKSYESLIPDVKKAFVCGLPSVF